MSAYKTDGIWRYRIVVKRPDGSKQRISGTPEINTKAAALTEERLHIERLKVPSETKAIQSPPFETFAATWLDRHVLVAGNKSSTRAQRESHLRVHLTPEFQGLSLDQITGVKIANLQASLLGSMKRSSAASVLTALEVLLRDAVAWGALARLPEFPERIKVTKAKKIALTDAQQAALMEACATEEERLELIFALDTGARAGEQLGIQWQDIDFVKRRIHIRRQRYAGETRETKTGIERFVDMTERLADSLGAADPRPLNGGEANGVGYVFHSGFNRPFTYSHLAALLIKLCARAGITGKGKHPPFGWHVLRHTFATRLINRDVPTHVIQRWLGHTTATHTADYAHQSDELGAKYIRALDDSNAPHPRQIHGSA